MNLLQRTISGLLVGASTLFPMEGLTRGQGDEFINEHVRLAQAVERVGIDV